MGMPTNKQNCWEIKKCGREPGGVKVSELGVCPAATASIAHGKNGGKYGGRICWAIAGTLCGGRVQGSYAQKQITCLTCDFFDKVSHEEGAQLVMLLPGQIYQPPQRSAPVRK